MRKVKKQKESFEKKIQKDCINNIVFGIPGSNSYKKIGFGKYSLEQVAKINVETLRKMYEKTYNSLVNGEVIFNKNLKDLLK